MLRSLLTGLIATTSLTAIAQNTFKAGWNNYPVGTIIHEYSYTYTYTDSVRLYLSDSTKTYVTPDSMVTMSVTSSVRDKNLYKTVNYLNDKKRIVKTEEYRNDDLQETNEWKYDDKNRKIQHLEDNKLTGNKFRKAYDYNVDKKTGETVVTESSYNGGKIEFYTKCYYDKNGVKTKEVRLNDNNKDVVHIESYTYGENGKLKERSVYFPEFKVTKKFEEKAGSQLPKCFKLQPMGIPDKPTLATKITYTRKLAMKNQAVLLDGDCHDFEYRFTNLNSCDVTFSSTNINNVKKVTFKLKEKVM